MKHLLILLLAGITINSVKAQDTILFENDWFLTEMQIDGVIIPVPSNSEITTVPFKIYDIEPLPDTISTEACNTLKGIATFPAVERIVFGDLTATLIECSLSVNTAFENNYFNFLFDNEGQELDYFITVIDDPPTGDQYGLTFLNSDGDLIAYLSTDLSSTSFNNTALTIYPNPTTDLLQWNLEGVIVETAKIFGLDGRLLKTLSVQNNQLDVSFLSSGIYLLELSGVDGRLVKRFIKN